MCRDTKHGGIVTAERRAREVNPDTLLSGQFMEASPQARVAGDTAGNHDSLKPFLCRGTQCLEGQDFDHRLLETGGDISPVLIIDLFIDLFDIL